MQNAKKMVKKLCHRIIYIMMMHSVKFAFANDQNKNAIFIYDDKVSIIVSGIMSYTSWPNLHELPRLCISSTAHYANVLEETNLSHHIKTYTTVVINDLTTNELSQCNAIYFGSETPAQQIEINQLHGPPLLTISEQNSECHTGSNFCLRFSKDRAGFSANLDSLSRSGVKVNPNVLLLALSDQEKND